MTPALAPRKGIDYPSQLKGRFTTGLQAGGRTGLTAVVTALLFLSALFFAPAFAVVPPYAYGPALIVVGLLMVAPVTQLNFDALDEIIPAFTVIVLMSFKINRRRNFTPPQPDKPAASVREFLSAAYIILSSKSRRLTPRSQFIGSMVSFRIPV